MVDDVLGLLVLGLITGLTRGNASALGLAALAVGAIGFIGFVVVVAAFGTRIVSALAPRIDKAQIERGELAAALSICLGLSVVAGAIGLAAIVGAFLAGMAFSETRRRWGAPCTVRSGLPPAGAVLLRGHRSKGRSRRVGRSFHPRAHRGGYRARDHRQARRVRSCLMGPGSAVDVDNRRGHGPERRGGHDRGLRRTQRRDNRP